ncbi:MAG: amidohydrolase family protein [Chitinophagaceae bacterium]
MKTLFIATFFLCSIFYKTQDIVSVPNPETDLLINSAQLFNRNNYKAGTDSILIIDSRKTSTASYDIVIVGGRVIDPQSNLDAVRNVGIKDGRIVAVSRDKLLGKQIIDATGLVVAPGFIDLHSHGQSLPSDRMQGFDGVTTALELESGILPISDWYDSQAKSGRMLNYGASVAWTFARIQELENIPVKADLVWFQQAFSLKKWINDPATPLQIENIIASIEQGLREGGIGVGINAGYAPGGGFRELLAVHKLAAKYQVPTFTHISCANPNDPKSSAECVGQVIAFATVAGDRAHICHLNSSSQKQIGETADMIRKAQAKGIRITTEAYTYGAASTVIGSAGFAPEAMHSKGIDPTDFEYNGKQMDEASYNELRTQTPGAIVVWHFLNLPKDQSFLDEAVLFPGAAIASDALPWIDKKTSKIIRDDAWPLPATAFAHPRSAGTFTRLLAQWVRERKVLTLSEAIRKSSLIPAMILESSVPQMKKMGRLQQGMNADIIIFDPATVQDNASFSNPNQPATGMKYVLVNGVPVIFAGQLIRDARPGKAVRR